MHSVLIMEFINVPLELLWEILHHLLLQIYRLDNLKKLLDFPEVSYRYVDDALAIVRSQFDVDLNLQ